ncbi:MAG: hypothetical protein COS85_23140 [Armatimonadetes bacterium CG07_land_8_20_14_0_80_59_28]|nr:MAG: hypothetical protein COS85_23140 [Armatimonadetes bacterium CG07_land_8_20_14_0_80_59_28]
MVVAMASAFLSSHAIGNEIAEQGVCPTEAIVGNSSMAAGFTKEGRLCTLFFPSVGAWDQVPYFTNNIDGADTVDYYGALPQDGSFAGLKVNGEFSWLMDKSKWSCELHYEQPTIGGYQTGVLTISYSNDRVPLRVVEYAFIPFGLNVLVRHFEIKSTSGRWVDLRFVYYGQFNLNETDQHPPFKIQKPYGADFSTPNLWLPAMNTVVIDGAQSLLWRSMDLLGGVPLELRIAATTDEGKTIAPIVAAKVGRRPYAGSSAFPDAGKLPPPKDSSNVPMLIQNAAAEWDLGNVASAQIDILIATGDSKSTSQSRLDTAQQDGFVTLKKLAVEPWATWLQEGTYPQDMSQAEIVNYERWLITLKMLADKDSGGIIASPNLQPQYYGCWPRDGVYQAVAHLMSGHIIEAEKFLNWLFTTATMPGEDHWTQCYNVRTGTGVGIPSPDIQNNLAVVEEDQMGTVLWGLWVFQKQVGRMPSEIDVGQVKKVADYIVSRITTSGLLEASLDWHEDPRRDIGQSLYTNAVAVAGLYAAREFLADKKYTEQADRVRDAIESLLYDNTKQTFATGVYLKTNLQVVQPQVQVRAEVQDRTPPDFYYNYNTMAFAWPYHLFDLTDERVKRQYDKVSRDLSLSGHRMFLPAYLFSHLYVWNCNDGSLRLQHLTELASGNDLLTSVGYLKDEVDGASRPLGWSQAFGVLSLLAEHGVLVPMIPTEQTPAALLSGEWRGTAVTSFWGQSWEVRLTLSQKDKKVTGTWSGRVREGYEATANIQGAIDPTSRQLSFEVKEFTSNSGQWVPARYRGTLSDDGKSVKGIVTSMSPEGLTATWSAKKQESAGSKKRR